MCVPNSNGRPPLHGRTLAFGGADCKGCQPHSHTDFNRGMKPTPDRSRPRQQRFPVWVFFGGAPVGLKRHLFDAWAVKEPAGHPLRDKARSKSDKRGRIFVQESHQRIRCITRTPSPRAGYSALRSCVLVSCRKSTTIHSGIASDLRIFVRRSESSSRVESSRRVSAVWGFRAKDVILGVDSFSILFNHRSFQKPAVFPGFLVAF